MNPKKSICPNPGLNITRKGCRPKSISPSSPSRISSTRWLKNTETSLPDLLRKKNKLPGTQRVADRLATALADLGVKKGDTVALYLLNSPQYVISYFAVLRLGAKVTPISPVYTSIEVKHQIEDSEAKTAICQNILYDNLEKAGVHPERVILTSIEEYLPSLKKWFGKRTQAKAYGRRSAPFGGIAQKGGGLLFSGPAEKISPQPPRVTIDPREDLAALPYTGGTTGLPKAAMLTHRNMVALQAQTLASGPSWKRGRKRSWPFCPFSIFTARWWSCSAAWPGRHPGPVHHPGYRRDPLGHGTVSGLGFLRRADPF